MKMFLVGFAFVGTLVTGSSGAPVIGQDHSASTETPPTANVSYTEKPRATRVVDAEYQLTDQERVVIAFLRLKADAERDARQALVLSRQDLPRSDASASSNSPH
jgi:hypothetical protein